MSRYSIAGLEQGIINTRRNIQVLKDAIASERATVKDYEKKIRDLAYAEVRKKEADAHGAKVIVEIDK